MVLCVALQWFVLSPWSLLPRERAYPRQPAFPPLLYTPYIFSTFQGIRKTGRAWCIDTTIQYSSSRSKKHHAPSPPQKKRKRKKKSFFPRRTFHRLRLMSFSC